MSHFQKKKNVLSWTPFTTYPHGRSFGLKSSAAVGQSGRDSGQRQTRHTFYSRPRVVDRARGSPVHFDGLRIFGRRVPFDRDGVRVRGLHPHVGRRPRQFVCKNHSENTTASINITAIARSRKSNGAYPGARGSRPVWTWSRTERTSCC